MNTQNNTIEFKYTVPEGFVSCLEFLDCLFFDKTKRKNFLKHEAYLTLTGNSDALFSFQELKDLILFKKYLVSSADGTIQVVDHKTDCEYRLSDIYNCPEYFKTVFNLCDDKNEFKEFNKNFIEYSHINLEEMIDFKLAYPKMKNNSETNFPFVLNFFKDKYSSNFFMMEKEKYFSELNFSSFFIKNIIECFLIIKNERNLNSFDMKDEFKSLGKFYVESLGQLDESKALMELEKVYPLLRTIIKENDFDDMDAYILTDSIISAFKTKFPKYEALTEQADDLANVNKIFKKMYLDCKRNETTSKRSNEIEK